MAKAIGIGRTSLYSRPTTQSSKDARAIQELTAAHAQHPLYGVRRLSLHLGWSENKTRRIRRITQAFHDELANELEARQQELNDQLKLLTSDNKSFQVTASYLLDLAQRSAELFKESDEALQQKLLEYVLSNIELNDKKLSYILNDPFRTIVETKKKALSDPNPNIWCTRWVKVYTKLGMR